MYFCLHKKIIKRINCLNDDEIYVTGNIGDPSVGLCILKNKFKTSNNLKNYFVEKYFKPKLAYGFIKNCFKFAIHQWIYLMVYYRFKKNDKK